MSLDRDTLSTETNLSQSSGVVLVILIMVLIPLIALVGALTVTMRTNTDAVLGAAGREKAFQASECGATDTVYRLKSAGLTGGTVVTKDLGLGMSYSAAVVDLSTDLVDNDNDTQVDESDEHGFDVTITGSYSRYTLKITINLRLATPPPPFSVALSSIQSAVTLFRQSPQIQFDFKGNGFVTGIDTNMDGTIGPDPAVSGLAIQQPATLVDLTANYAVDDASRITGLGGAPSLGVSTSALDLNQLVLDVQSNADLTLSATHTNEDWRTGPGGPFGPPRR